MTEQERIEFLKQNSPYALPDNPSSSGWSASQIKRMYYKGLLALLNFLKEDKTELDSDIEALVSDLASEVTTRGTEDARILGDAKDYTDTKVSGLKDISTLIYTDLSTSSTLSQFIAKGTNPYFAILSNVPYLIKCTNAQEMINLIATSYNDCYYGLALPNSPFSSLTHKTYATDSDIDTLDSNKEDKANKKQSFSASDNKSLHYPSIQAVISYLTDNYKTKSAQESVDNELTFQIQTINGLLSTLTSNAVKKTAGAKQTLNDEIEFKENVTFKKDVYVEGTTYQTKVDDLVVKDFYIVTNSDGAELTQSGFVIKINNQASNNAYGIIYDGNTGYVSVGLGTYTSGTFTSSSLVPLLARYGNASAEEFLMWDEIHHSLAPSGIDKQDITDLQNVESVGTKTIPNIQKSGGVYSVITESVTGGRSGWFTAMINAVEDALSYVVDELNNFTLATINDLTNIWEAQR